LRATYCPAQAFTSEALLALPELRQLPGRRILILRGEGGREHLRETLRARGAEVDYLEVIGA
jgi:uroporphyrinogen-III synthase